MTHHYWPDAFTYWTLGALLLYVVCLVKAVPRTSSPGWGIAGLVVGFLGSAPVFAWASTFFGLEQLWDVAILSAVYSFVCCIPLFFAMRTHNARWKARRQARANEAEQWLRKLGV